jgi:2-iminoacetate synthase ThiH
MKVNNLTLLVNYGKNFSCQEKCSYCNWRTGARFKEIDFTDPVRQLQ